MAMTPPLLRTPVSLRSSEGPVAEFPKIAGKRDLQADCAAALAFQQRQPHERNRPIYPLCRGMRNAGA